MTGTAHVAPLAAWMAEHHPEIPFDRTRWAGTLGWTADQIAAALDTWPVDRVPTSAELNAAIRRGVDRAAADRARARTRQQWDQFMGRAS